MFKALRKKRARRAVLRDVGTWSHDDAAKVMRMCARNGIGDQELMVALSARALETAPTKWRHVYAKWAEVYAAGRRVKIKTGGFIIEPAPTELIEAVDEIYGE